MIGAKHGTETAGLCAAQATYNLQLTTYNLQIYFMTKSDQVVGS